MCFPDEISREDKPISLDAGNKSAGAESVSLSDRK